MHPCLAHRGKQVQRLQRPALRFRNYLLLTLVSGAVVAAGFSLANRSRPDATAERTTANKAREADGVNAASGIPLRIPPLARPLFAKDSPETVCINRLLQEPPQGPLTVSYCCHLLRLYGLGAFRHSRFTSGREVIRALTDQQLSASFFGEPIFFQTRSGIRYRDPTIQNIANGENHRDFCLTTLAELGLPLSTPMTTVDGWFTLRDLLRDSVENFDIKQRELAWTAIAYALYLPPQRGWTNRYKESFTFDDVANALIQTPLHKVSCGGAHLLDAMTILLRANATIACLSEPVREALRRHLQQWTALVVRSQTKEGYWTLDWHVIAKEEAEGRHTAPPDTSYARLLATGAPSGVVGDAARGTSTRSRRLSPGGALAVCGAQGEVPDQESGRFLPLRPRGMRGAEVDS